MTPENNLFKKVLRFLAIALNPALIAAITILAPDPTGLSWPAYLLSPLLLVGAIVAVVVYATFALLALSPQRRNLESHSRTGAVISLVCCIFYIGGNVIWGLGIWGNFSLDKRYVIPAILAGFWLVYFGTMQALAKEPPEMRIKIGLAVTIPIMLIACLGLYVNLATIFSPRGYQGYFFSPGYLTAMLINTFLISMWFGLLWEPMRQRFITPIGATAC